MADAKDDKSKDGKGTDAPKDWFPEAMGHLKNMGIPLLDDTTIENVWERICVAANAVSQGKSGEDKKPEDKKPEDTTQTPPISLSLQKQQEKAVTFARKELSSRVEELNKSGRITPDIATKLKADVNKVKLSFGDDGELNENKLITQIESYEALPEGNLFEGKRKVDLSKTKTVEGSGFDSPEPDEDPEHTKKVLDAWPK